MKMKFVALSMAALTLASLVGCGPYEDPKVRFLRECKMSLSADECQQLAYNKSQEEQARIMKSNSYGTYANQPGGYVTPGYNGVPVQSGYVQQQPVYVQQPQNTFVDSAAGAVVGGVAGAVIGNAINNRTNDRRDADYNRQYQQNNYQAPQQRQYTPPAQSSWNSSTTTASQTSTYQSSAPKATAVAPRPSQFAAPSTPPAPRPTATVSAPRPSAFASKPSTSSSSTVRSSPFKR